jgi:hypothetical protein
MDKELEKKSLWEYHMQLADALERDISEYNKAGFNTKNTQKVMRKYKTKSWKKAYKAALAYHQSQYITNEYDQEFYDNRQQQIDDWIWDNEINLGCPPKLSYELWCLPQSIAYILAED